MTVMNVEHNIYCSGVKHKGAVSVESDLELNLWDKQSGWNLKLNLDLVHSHFYKNTSARFIDFVEIATYVYCADQVFKRGGIMDVDQFGAAWRRQLHFHIPVRDPDFWESAEVQNTLKDTLHFLSDDYYQFSFSKAKKAPQLQEYLKFFNDDLSASPPEQVMMFSGGLDSLGGAIQEAVIDKRRVMLVNHRSTKKLNTIHSNLMAQLSQAAGRYAPDHIHVDVNKKIKAHNKEYTQRTRSFLFLALGSSVANMLGLDSLRFYENGVISLNLPISAQTVGSRSTRTTHPKVLHQYSNLISLIAGKPFKVENPFIWKTRGEIIKLIVDAGCADLIGTSMSCAHVWESTKEKTHCGKCSQCIDRRIGMYAVGADKYDPDSIYRTNVFIDEAEKEEDQLLNAEFLERANNIRSIRDEMDFLKNYPQLTHVLPFFDSGTAASNLSRCLELYRRHADEVTKTLDILGQKYMPQIRRRDLAHNCMLRMVYESNSVQSAPTSNTIVETKIIEVESDSDMSNFELKVHLDQRLDTIGHEFASVKEENGALKKDLASSIAAIAGKVEPEYFQWVFTILGAGSVSSAAKLLGIPNSSLTVKLKQYAAKGGVYATLFSMTKARKGSGVKCIVGFDETFIEHQPEKGVETAHVHDLLEGLENLDASNWPALRSELIELVKEELL